MNRSVSTNSRTNTWLLIILIAALALRLIFVLVIDPTPDVTRNDALDLTTVGLRILNNTQPVSPSSGPGFLVYNGILQKLLGGDTAFQAIRILDCFYSTALCAFAYLIGRRYFSVKAGLLAALFMAVNPILIIEVGSVLTETMFMTFIYGAFALFAVRQDNLNWRIMVIIGLLLGLGALTRAVGLLIPAILIVYLFLQLRRKAIPLIAVLAVTYILTLLTYTVSSGLRWGEWVIGAHGLSANIYIGTTDWCGPQCIDNQLGVTAPGTKPDDKYLTQAAATITGDPIGYLKHRLENLVSAYLQPHNTVYFKGESIKSAVTTWWSQGHTVSTLSTVTQIESFWPKLALYVFHYLFFGFGVIGLLIAIRRFWYRWPVYGLIGYFTGIHLLLTANPRYLFPTQPMWWLFASFALIQIVHSLHSALKRQVSEPEAVNQLSRA